MSGIDNIRMSRLKTGILSLFLDVRGKVFSVTIAMGLLLFVINDLW
jgi:hypothetical protein